jgi:hypothetical protein
MIDRKYSDEDFVHPTAVCDIIMKGGITSGVVFPLAIAELAKHFRFANIGGTSAGAIAAAAAAAAEYGRHIPGKGFMRLAQAPSEVGPNLLSLFQPTPKLKPLFQILTASLRAKTTATKFLGIVFAAIGGYWPLAALGALPGVLIAMISLWHGAALGFLAFGFLFAVVGLVIGVLVALKGGLDELVKNNFGLCPGIRQPGYDGSGFTDWLADLIDQAAGRDPNADPPLTFGDLAPPVDPNQPTAHRKIRLSMMTTNLMLRRPYTLPFQDDAKNLFHFKREDFEKIFPRRIVDYLVAHAVPEQAKCGEKGEYYRLPSERLPIIVAARMSLSFPGLISAVPLYARDFTFVKKVEQDMLRCCLFSDGGLSSNFPIHFFDNLLPSWPTFGISLDEYNVDRDRGKPRDGRESRVWMPDPKMPRAGLLLPVQSFDGLFGFVFRLVEAAKDWQDNLQSTLVGYRDRIVHIYLKPQEGGLNIVMGKELVDDLVGYGATAGDELRDKFNLDEHRWRRFLVALDRIQEVLTGFTDAYEGGEDGSEPFKTFLDRYTNPVGYPQAPSQLAALRQQAAELAALGKKWQKAPSGNFPRQNATLRITAKP